MEDAGWRIFIEDIMFLGQEGVSQGEVLPEEACTAAWVPGEDSCSNFQP